MRVAEWMNVAHRAGDLTLRDFENLRLRGRIEIARAARLDFRVAALVDERRQPADLQFAADDNQKVRLLELEDEARLRFDKMRVLIPFDDRVNGNVVATDLTRDRREVLGGGHDVELALCEGRHTREDRQQQPCNVFHRTTSSYLTRNARLTPSRYIDWNPLADPPDPPDPSRTDAPHAPRWQTGTETGARW